MCSIVPSSQRRHAAFIVESFQHVSIHHGTMHHGDYLLFLVPTLHQVRIFYTRDLCSILWMDLSTIFRNKRVPLILKIFDRALFDEAWSTSDILLEILLFVCCGLRRSSIIFSFLNFFVFYFLFFWRKFQRFCSTRQIINRHNLFVNWTSFRNDWRFIRTI